MLIGLGMVELLGWMVLRSTADHANIRAGLFWTLIAVEAFAMARLALLVILARPAQHGLGAPGGAADTGAQLDVDVSIVVTNEDALAVRTSVLAALAVVDPARVLLIGPETKVRALATELGVDCIACDGPWVVATALALEWSPSPFLALTRASSALVAGALGQLGDDDRCAWLQTQTVAPEARSLLQHLQQLRVDPTVDRWHAAGWTGEGSIVRVAAFRGHDLARGPLATTIALQRAGWHGRIGPLPLVIDQGDRSLVAAQREAARAASMRLRVLHSRRSPLWVPGLTLRQRLIHLATLLDDLAGAVTFLVLAVIAASVAVGEVPVQLSWAVLTFGATVYVGTVCARLSVSGGLLRPGALAGQDVDRVGESLSAVLRSILPARFSAERSAGEISVGSAALRHRSAAAAIAVALEAALVARAVSTVFGRGVPDRSKATDVALLAMGVLATLPVLTSLRIIVRSRQLRASGRQRLTVPVELDGLAGRLIDLGSRGAGIEIARSMAIGAGATVTIFAQQRMPIQVRMEVVRCTPSGDGFVVGLQIVERTPSPAFDQFVALWAGIATSASVRATDDPRFERNKGAGWLPFHGSGTRFARIATAATMVLVGTANLPPYSTSLAITAPPTGTFTLSKSAPTEVLYGSTAVYGLNACSSRPTPRYNLALRDVLPKGATYVAGSGAPAPTRVLVSATAGTTTLLWENISDLQTNSCFSVKYSVAHTTGNVDTGFLHVGDTIVNTATSYANTDPRYVPKFDPITGVALAATGGTQDVATASAASKIVPITIDKTEPSPEQELLRGVHDHSVVYTLTVRNNAIKATNATTVDDWLPAGLEFLGCGATDNTPDQAVEYPGAPRLDVSTPDLVTNCLAPTLVETVQVDPDGTGSLPLAVYTHVRWSSGDLAAAGAPAVITYRAAIANRENVLFPDPAPPTDGAQGANLANNTGALTTEQPTEQSLTNLATVGGTYTGILSTGVAATQTWNHDTETVVSEDLAVQKSACNATSQNLSTPSGSGCLNGVAYGGVTTWTLRIETSEYRSSSAITLNDTLGDGLQYVDGSAVLSDGTNATTTFTPSTSIAADGTQQILWSFDAVLPASPNAVMATDAVYTITYTTTTLANFRKTAQPVLAFDTLHDSVAITGTSAVVSGDDTTGPLAISDVSAASITSNWGSISKKTLSGSAALAAPNAATLGCASGTSAASPDVVPRFTRNDIVCFELKVTFPTGIRVRDALLTDFIPPNTAYVGYAAYSDSSPGFEKLAARSSPTDPVVWAFGADPTAVPRYTSAAGDAFHVVVAVKVSDDPSANNNYDIVDNLLKATSVATDGSSVALRALDSYRIVEPELALYKGVVGLTRAGASVAGYPKAGPVAVSTDTTSVRQGDVVKFEIVVPNVAPQFADTSTPSRARVDQAGRQVGDAVNAAIWDNLPSGMSCADLTPSLAVNLTAALVLRTGALALPVAPTPTLSGLDCTANRVSFSVDMIPAGYQLRVDYTVAVGPTVAAGFSYTDTAGVREYNDIGRGTKTYQPTNNIDPAITTALANSPVARDDSKVLLPAATISKSASTGITEQGNDGPTQATIGEKITYTVNVTVPAGTSIYDASVNDELPTGLDYIEGTARVTASPVLTALPLGAFGTTDEPAGFTLADTTNGWKLAFPATTAGYRNATDVSQIFTVVYSATVMEIAGNVHGTTRKNTASLTWSAAQGGAKVATPTAATTIIVVEPLPTITKTHSPAGPFGGNDVVTYTVSVGDTAGRSPLHDVAVSDCVPAGLGSITPSAMVAPSTVAVGAAGSCTGGTKITWDLAGRDSPTPTGIAAGTSVALTYTAVVTSPAPADGPLTNTAVVTATSISGTSAGERTTYLATVQDTIRANKPTIAKTVSPAALTNGQVATYTVSVTVPARLATFDAAVTDVFPANLVFDQYGAFPAAASSAGCTVTGGAGHTIAAQTNGPGGARTIGWFLGDISTGADPCVVTLTYQAHVAKAAVDGNTIANVASLSWNLVDKLADVATLDATFDRSITAGASVAVVAPKLAITKAVDDVDHLVDGGQLVTYTITVTNTGTSAAYDIAVLDTLPAGLLAPAAFGGNCQGASSAAYAASNLTWTLFTGTDGLAPAASCTVTYQQHVAAAVTLTDGKAMLDTASIPQFFGDADRAGSGAADYVAYAGPSAAAQVVGYKPTLSIVKTTTAGSDVGQAVIGQPFTWTVTVTNTSPLKPEGVRTAHGIDVTDALPPNWRYAATTSITGAAACAKAPAPPSAALAGAVQTLTWTNLCDLAPGETAVIVYTATPQPAAAVTPGLVDTAGVHVPHINTATLTAVDAGGNPLPTSSDTASATVKSVDLKIVKTDASADNDGAPTSAGFTIGEPGRYFLDVSNAGPDATSGAITVTDALPAGLALASAPTGDGWTCTPDKPAGGASFTCTAPGPLGAGHKLAQITVVVDVGVLALNGPGDTDKDPTTGLVSNTATVSGTDTDRNPKNNSDEESTPIKRQPNFAIDKTLDPATPFVPGTPVQYILTASNVGPSPASGEVIVDDPLPDGLRFVAASGDGWDCTSSAAGTGFARTASTAKTASTASTASTDDNGAARCTRTVDELGIGGLPPIVVTVDVDPALTTAAVVNVAHVGHPDDHDPSNDFSEQSSNPAPVAALTISKDDGGATFAVGQMDATYTIVVSNQGPSFEQGKVVVTDTAPVGLRLIAAAGSGWTCDVTAGTDFTAATGALACTWTGDRGKVPPGMILDAITVTAEVGANAILDPAPAAENLVTNSATVTGTTDTVAHTSKHTTPVTPRAALTIVKTHDPVTEPWKVGSSGSFVLAVGNDGPSGEFGPVVVTDPLPTGATFTSAHGDGWACTLLGAAADGTGGTVSCAYARPGGLGATAVLLDKGGALPVITVDVAVTAAAAPEQLPNTNALVNSATVVGTTDPEAHVASDQVPVVPVVDLQLGKAHDGTTFQVGGEGVYELTVTNAGPNVSAAPVVVADTLPSGLTFVAGSGIGWTCTAAGQDVTCTAGAPVPVGAVSTIAVTVDVGPGAFHGDQQLTNSATVTGPDLDPLPANNSDDDQVAVEPSVDLSIDKSHSSDFVVGRPGTFALVVTNNGPNEHDASPITVTDTLPAGLTYTSASGDGWNCAAVDGVVITCTRPGTLSSGASAPPISVVVGVGVAAEQGIVNTARVGSTERDVTPENNQDSDAVTALPLSDLRITKSLLSPMTLDGEATWRLVIDNAGPSTARDVVVTDEMPIGLSLVQPSSTAGACVVAAQTITCTLASLDDGQSFNVDLLVRVDAIPATGTYSNTARVAAAAADPDLTDDVSTAAGPAQANVIVASQPPPPQQQVELTPPKADDLPATGAAVLGVLGAATAFTLAGLLLLGLRRRKPRRAGPDG